MLWVVLITSTSGNQTYVVECQSKLVNCWCSCCRTNHEAAFEAEGRQLRFLANVDPVDVARALNGLKQETTLVVVVSKTFTTAETMLNARTVR